VSEDIHPPSSDDTAGVMLNLIGEPATMRYRVQEMGSGVRNVTVYYESSTGIAGTLPMRLDEGDQWDGYYLADIPAFPNGTRVDYRIESFDNLGHSLAIDNHYEVIYRNAHLGLRTELVSVDPNAFSASVEISVQGNFAGSRYNDIMIASTDEQGRIVREPRIEVERHGLYFNNAQKPMRMNFTMFGNPLAFPFDKYDLYQVVTFPEKTVDIDYDVFEFNPYLRENWVVSGIINNEIRTLENATEISRTIRIERSLPQTFGIMAPIVAGFFLLGATTILRHSISELAVKMTIVVGVFALIFSVTPLISDRAPFSYGLYTAADGLVTALLVMNLVYAILAIISYRYEKTRGRHEYLVGLVVGLAVILLAIPFKWEEAYPLIFLFLLGLSYGFVTRPAWSMIGAKLKWKKDKTSKRLSHIYHKLRKVLPTFHG
ncbi:MAG TPA: hypothetical protein VF172_13725, partial [Nitrososphaera sp.]